MIALALIVTVAALVMPSIGHLVRSTEIETTARNVESILTMARADAQRDGQAILVYAQEQLDGPIGLYAEVFDPLGESEQDRRPPILFTLPSGMSFSSRAPEPDELQDFMGAQGGLEEPLDEPAEDGEGYEAGEFLETMEADRLEIAIFLPDGSALGRGRRYLHVGKGQGFELGLNQWTGSAKLTEVKADPGEFGEGFGDEELGADEFTGNPAQGGGR